MDNVSIIHSALVQTRMAFQMYECQDIVKGAPRCVVVLSRIARVGPGARAGYIPLASSRGWSVMDGSETCQSERTASQIVWRLPLPESRAGA